jgi:hypothetical protein
MFSAAIVACLLGSSGPEVNVTGYLGSRYSQAQPDGRRGKALGVARSTILTEGNVQLRVEPHEGYELVTDLSLFVNIQSSTPGSLVPAPGNQVVPAELYANLGFHPNVNGLVGRKRVVWGSSFAWNPSDLLNPPKDPTDPAYQRAGAWMARVEAPFEHFTLTALWAPQATRVENGLPRRFLEPPDSGPAQQLWAARLYALVAETDLNLAWYLSDGYADVDRRSHRIAASFSRYFGDYELHVEAIGRRGRDTVIADPRCVRPALAADPTLPFQGCTAVGIPVSARPRLDDPALYAEAIVGSRTVFADESLLSVEYFFNGVGLTGDQFSDRQTALATLVGIAGAGGDVGIGGPLTAETLGQGGAGGQPVRYRFRPVRRHYAFLVYQKPKIADDFTALLTVIAGLEDGSGLAAPGVSWSAREWLNLSLLGFVPWGETASEFGSSPLDWRAVLEARAYY